MHFQLAVDFREATYILSLDLSSASSTRVKFLAETSVAAENNLNHGVAEKHR